VAYLWVSIYAPAQADEIQPCRLPKGVASLNLDNLPPAVAAALTQEVGEIVPATVDFDATDLVITNHSRRFIFSWRQGRRWVVATELGGLNYSDPIFAFDLAPQGSAIKIGETRAYPNTVCRVATQLLKVRRRR
jgi:hypothetical protein